MANREKWGLQTVPLLGCTFRRAAFVGRDMIGLVALDFVLRIVFRSVMHMTLVVEIRGVDGDDGPRHPACFRIPAYMIADLEPLGHLVGHPRTTLTETAVRIEIAVSLVHNTAAAKMLRMML